MLKFLPFSVVPNANRAIYTAATGAAAPPSPTEMAEMAKRAGLVLHIVDKLRKLASAQEDDHKRKKRPWEDDVPGGMQDDEGDNAIGSGNGPGANDVNQHCLALDADLNYIFSLQSMAQKDMEIIRSKRGQGAGSAGGPPGQAKAKYRKRSVRVFFCLPPPSTIFLILLMFFVPSLSIPISFHPIFEFPR
jgi:hypothetical protein